MSGARLEMNETLYDYLDSVSDRELPILAELREETRKDLRFNMQVSPMQGQFMGVLVRALAPKKIVEVGVYTGYSSLSMALAAPEARMWCFDISEDWTALARKFWKKAGVDDRVSLTLAPGADGLQGLIDDGHAGTIDLVFIDADKPNYPVYWDKAHTLLRPGGLVIADNTLFQSLAPPKFTDDEIRAKFAHYPPEAQEEIVAFAHGVRAFNEYAHKDERFALSMIPVGDGMTFGVKL